MHIKQPPVRRSSRVCVDIDGLIRFYASSTSPHPISTRNVHRFGELGWVEGRTVNIEIRWSEGRPERVAEITSEFVQQKVDVVIGDGRAAVVLKKATTSIPIVFAPANDPVGVGLVANLSHPGGNVTGISIQQTESAGKRFELLRQVVPNLHKLAILFDSGYSASVHEMEAVRENAQRVVSKSSPRYSAS